MTSLLISNVFPPKVGGSGRWFWEVYSRLPRTGCVVRRVVGGADLIVVNCRNTACLVRELWAAPPERVRVLHPGVDAARFRPAPRDPAVRARLGWGNRPVVLTVSRLQKRKGHDH